MTARATIERAHALLDQAAEARERRSHDRCLGALNEARDLLLDTPERALLGKVSWRLAKAAYDFGTPEQMLDAVTPLLEAGEAFAHHGPGRRAMAPIAKRWWDTRGYADHRVARLWEAWSDSYRAEQDPWMEAMGQAQLAWHLACAGDQTELDAIIERYLAMDPRAFGAGPHRHPDAPDTPSSVWWAQLELLRTGLWAAAWSGRRDRARDLADAIEDAAESAELDRAADPWFLDPLIRVGLAFDLREILDTWYAPWEATLSASDTPRARFHLALGRSLELRRTGDHFAAWEAAGGALEHALEQRFGPEWTVDALVARAGAEAGLPGASRSKTLDEITELKSTYGLWGLVG